MKVYIAQIKVLSGKPSENFTNMKNVVARAQKAGADMVLFPEYSITGNLNKIGCLQYEGNFKDQVHKAQDSLRDLSKDISILVGSSFDAGEGEFVYCKGGEFVCWDEDFDVYSRYQEFTVNKEDFINEIGATFAKESGRPLIYVSGVGCENSGKNIYALDGCSRVFDKTGKISLRLPQLEWAEVLVEIKAGKVKALPNVALAEKSSPKSAKVKEPIAQIHDILVYMIRESLAQFHIQRMVIGASGGIDSAVCAVLYSEAIGAENVYLVNMPTRFNSDTTRNAARDLAKNLGCPYMVAPISDMLNAVCESLSVCTFERSDRKIAVEGINYENLQARTRSSSVLLTIASVLGAGVTCNGNKSEATTGYCTLYGDTCGVMCALGDLWKTQVYELARHINRKKTIIPKASIEIPASAELSDAMKVDEGKGDPVKYPYHDKLFAYWVENNESLEATEKLLEKGTLVKEIGADPQYFKSLFKTKKAALEDMRLWHRRFRGIALAKRIQFPPILSISGHAFGAEYSESQG